MEGTASIIRSYRDLLIWKAAVDLAVECYSTTRTFPATETYGMTSQIRRSSASIAANIAEGHGRESREVFVNYLRIAQGSLKELETHLIIAGRVGLMPSSELGSLLEKSDEIGKMIDR